MKRFRTSFLGLAFALVVLGTAYAPMSPATPKAYAFPVVVVGDAPSTLKWIGDALAWTAAKTVVNSLTQSVVTWINSGFDGSPAFVSDLNRNLGNLADAVADDFLNQLDDVVEDNTGLSVRAPFQDQINRALREEYYRTSSSYGFNTRHPYRDCQAGGFSLNGWFCQSQNLENNPWGRYLLARSELWNQVDQETQNRLRELDWGKGFLSWRGPCGRYGTGEAAAQNGNVDLNQKEKNVGCSIRTPGSVIEDQLVTSLGSPMRQLELADSVNEILSALMTQLVGQVLGGGGLSGLSEAGSGGEGSFANRLGASMSEGFAQQVAQVRTVLVNAQTGWQRIRDAASVARAACASSAKATQADRVLSQANARLAETTTALTEIQSIETERARLASSPTTQSSDITALTNRLSTLLSRTGGITEGEAEGQDTGDAEPGSLYSQMLRLADSCR